jgi:hypothetical protein
MTQLLNSSGAYVTGVSNKLYWHPYNAATNVVSANTYATNTKYIVALTYDGATTTLHQNGAFDVSLAAVQHLLNDIAPTYYYLGSGDPTPINTNFNLQSMMVYSTALTTSQRQTVEGYLAWRYTVTLTATHPYFYSRPAWTPTTPLPSGLSFDGTSQYLVSPLSAIPTAETGFFVVTAPIISGEITSGTPNSGIVVNLTTRATSQLNREFAINNTRSFFG